MPHFLPLLALVAGWTLAALATAEAKPTPAAQLKAVKKEVADAKAAFFKAWEKLPDPSQRQDNPKLEKLAKSLQRKQRDGFAVALEIARADRKSYIGLVALEWLLLENGALGVYDHPVLRSVLELMVEHYAANPKVGKAIAILANCPPLDSEPTYEQAVRLLNVVAEKNPDRTARGQATLGLAWLAKRQFVIAASRAGLDADRLSLESEKAFESVLRDYGDCRNLRSRGARPATATLAEEAKWELNDLRHLQVGRTAQDIEGEDLDGAKFKMSDYRGKVILLVFWASWCGPCMRDVPHEQELVERFKGRPFVLIGVNGDAKKEAVMAAVEKKQIPWRSFWNGEDGAGELAEAWNVCDWPTVYVIDHKGVIRHRHLRSMRLDEPLEKLVAEAEAEVKPGGR